MMLGGHIGTRVSALVDGRLTAAEEERVWAHVHACEPCRQLVEREGWVKTQLACLSLGPSGPAPDRLKGSLCGRVPWSTPHDPAAFGNIPLMNGTHETHRPRRYAGLAALGAGSVGVAMFGVLALGSPAEAPVVDRRLPTTAAVRSTDKPPTPAGPRVVRTRANKTEPTAPTHQTDAWRRIAP